MAEPQTSDARTPDDLDAQETRVGLICVNQRAIRDLLMLPPGYDVRALHIDPTRGTLNVFVAHPDLPPVEPGATPTDLLVAYETTTDADGRRTRRLASIDVRDW